MATYHCTPTSDWDMFPVDFALLVICTILCNCDHLPKEIAHKCLPMLTDECFVSFVPFSCGLVKGLYSTELK